MQFPELLQLAFQLVVAVLFGEFFAGKQKFHDLIKQVYVVVPPFYELIVFFERVRQNKLVFSHALYSGSGSATHKSMSAIASLNESYLFALILPLLISSASWQAARVSSLYSSSALILKGIVRVRFTALIKILIAVEMFIPIFAQIELKVSLSFCSTFTVIAAIFVLDTLLFTNKIISYIYNIRYYYYKCKKFRCEN